MKMLVNVFIRHLDSPAASSGVAVIKLGRTISMNVSTYVEREVTL